MKYYSYTLHTMNDWDHEGQIDVRVDVKAHNNPGKPFCILMFVTKEFLDESGIFPTPYIEDTLRNFKEKWIYNSRAAKKEHRKERYEFLTHGKHGKKRPK